jgi:hypothetical protein
VSKAYQEFEADGRMTASAYDDRVVDVMEAGRDLSKNGVPPFAASTRRIVR